MYQFTSEAVQVANGCQNERNGGAEPRRADDELHWPGKRRIEHGQHFLSRSVALLGSLDRSKSRKFLDHNINIAPAPTCTAEVSLVPRPEVRFYTETKQWYVYSLVPRPHLSPSSGHKTSTCTESVVAQNETRVGLANYLCPRS